MTTTRSLKKLGDKDYFTLIMGQSPDSKTYNKKGIGLPFFQGKKEFGKIHPIVEQYCSDPVKIAEPGDILMTVRAPVGPTNLADQRCCIGRGLSAIRCNREKVDLNYLYFFFKKFELEISKLGKGSTFDAITKVQLENIEIPLPPLATQRTIIAKLDEAFAQIDEAIALTQDNIKSTEEFTKSVLDKVFEEGGWERKKLGRIIDNYDGKRVPIKSGKRVNETGKYPYYGASGIIDYVDEYIYDGEFLLISEDGANLIARKYPIAFIANGKFWVNNHAHIVKGKEGVIGNKYLEYYFSNLDVSLYITGSAQPKLSQKMMNNIDVPLPPLSKQQEIVTYLDQVFAQSSQLTSQYQEKLVELKALKASVLQGAFSGELI